MAEIGNKFRVIFNMVLVVMPNAFFVAISDNTNQMSLTLDLCLVIVFLFFLCHPGSLFFISDFQCNNGFIMAARKFQCWETIIHRFFLFLHVL